MKKKTERVILFDAAPHISKEDAIDVAHSIYETLHESCPTCCMRIVGTLMSMLAIGYMKDYEKEKRIFPYDKWMKEIADGSIKMTDCYEHMDNSVN